MVGVTGAILGSAVIGAGASALASSKASKAANKAANVQAAAADRAAELQAQTTREQLALQEKLANQARADVMPWRQSGLRALGTLERLQSGTLPIQATPGYNFVRDQGMRAINAGVGAKYGVNSGARTKAALRYGTGLASQEYGNQYNRLANMAGVGQSASGTLANIGQAYGTQAGNTAQAGTTGINDLRTSAATARGSGYIGSANAFNQGLSGITNAIGTGLGYYGMMGGSNPAPTNTMFNPFYTGVS